MLGDGLMNPKANLEKRLKNLTEAFENLDKFIDGLGIDIPDMAKDKINGLLKSKDITELMEAIEESRPPKFVIMGRTGVGKSSLINAMFGSYLAKTSPVAIGTTETQQFNYVKDGEVLFEILDTRGIKESSTNNSQTAESALNEAIEKFEPDAFILITNASDRSSSLKEDINYLNTVRNMINPNLPIVTVINKIDELEPARIKDANEYSSKKISNINLKAQNVRVTMIEEEIENVHVIPVSSYIEWTHETPEELSWEEQAQLKIEFDGRYNIDYLVDFLEDNIDLKASIYLMMHYKIDQAIRKIANKFVSAFAGVAGVVGLSPIPLSDIYILVPLQMILISLIAYLNGIILDAKGVRDFFIASGGVAILGVGLRFVAQQGVKLLNITIPGAASAISGGIASSGTFAIGKGAISYFIDDLTMEETKKNMSREQQDYDGGSLV